MKNNQRFSRSLAYHVLSDEDRAQLDKQKTRLRIALQQENLSENDPYEILAVLGIWIIHASK